MQTNLTRAMAAAGGLAIAAALAVSCSATKEATKDAVSSASSMGSSAASAAGSAASSGASAASSVASSGASAASSVASSGASAASSVATSGASAVSSVASSVFNAPATTITAPGIGDVALNADGAAAFTRLGGAAVLGAPTAAAKQVTDADSGGQGWVYQFANGTIFDSPDRGAFLVQGELLKVYEKDGGPGGQLGWPTADEKETGGGPKVANGGWIGEFETGTITWLNDGKGNFSETLTKK